MRRAGSLISSPSSVDHWKVAGRGFVFSSDTFFVASAECAPLTMIDYRYFIDPSWEIVSLPQQPHLQLKRDKNRPMTHRKEYCTMSKIHLIAYHDDATVSTALVIGCESSKTRQVCAAHCVTLGIVVCTLRGSLVVLTQHVAASKMNMQENLAITYKWTNQACWLRVSTPWLANIHCGAETLAEPVQSKVDFQSNMELSLLTIMPPASLSVKGAGYGIN